MHSQSTVYQSTLSDIQQIIEARLRFLLQMKLYLTDIQADKIDIEEVIIFLKDVVGIKISTDHKKKSSLIEALKNNVDKQFKVYQELKKCFDIADKKVGLCLLRKLLEFYYRISFHKNKINANLADKLALESKADFSFNEHEALKSLQNLFEKIFPDEYKDIDKLIKIKENSHSYLSGGSTFGDTTICWKITWRPYWHRLKSLFEEVTKLKPQLQQISPEELQVKHDQILAFFRDTADNAIAEHGERNDNGNIELLKKQITLYFTYCESVKFLTQLRDQSKKEKQLNELYQNAINKISLVREELLKKLALLDEMLQQESQEKDAWYNETQVILVKLKVDILNLDKDIDLKRNDEDRIQSRMASMEEREADLNKKIIDLEEQISIKQSEKKRQEDDRQKKIKQQIEEENKKIAEFRDEKKCLLAEYKKEVSENRCQVKNQNLVQMTSQNEVKNNNDSNNSKLINEELKEKLRKLHQRDLDLICFIYQKDRSLKFRKIATLITKLGGTIAEIGNGTSHKRIYLNKLYSEFYSHLEEAEGATGGCTKPHGHARNSGPLSFFNIELIRALFSRANITLENIEKIKTEEAYASSSSTTANIIQVIGPVEINTRTSSRGLADSSVAASSSTDQLTAPNNLKSNNISGKAEKCNFSP